jgi:hypothetical protein
MVSTVVRTGLVERQPGSHAEAAMTRSSWRSLVPVAALCGGLLAAPAAAQDVQWTVWSKVDFSGALGPIMRLFAGSGESTEKNSIKGGRMRTDGGETQSHIVDLENGRFINIDHKAKTYTVVTLAQLVEYTKQMEAQAQAKLAEAKGQPKAEPSGEARKDSVEVRVRASVDRTGEKLKIAGYDAERVLLTAETEVLVTPEGETEKQQAGTLVIFMDSWHANGVPAEEAMRRMAEKAGPAVRAKSEEAAKNVVGAITSDPQARDAVEKAAREADKLGGFDMKSTLHIVLVPAGLKFNREQAFADEKGGGGSGLTAKKALGGLLRGAAGANRQEQAEPETKDPRQWTLARVRTEVRDMKTATLAASLFEAPAGYREIPFNPGVPAR